MKIGIMGGTFNPIHNGHIIIAQKAYALVPLDKVLFMPSGTSYMKKNVLETSKRIAMVDLAISSYPNFAVSTLETDRTGNTYTSETLEILTKLEPDSQYYFIIGADSLFQIESWRKPEKIFALSTLICAVREGYQMPMIQEKGNELSKLGAKILYLNIPPINISSTNIRARVKNNCSITELVPQAVAEYIKQEHLYYEED